MQSSEIMSTIVPMEGQSSNHLEMSEGVLYRLFLFRRAKRHRPFTGTHVIVFPLPDAKLLHVKVNADMAIDYLPT